MHSAKPLATEVVAKVVSRGLRRKKPTMTPFSRPTAMASPIPASAARKHRHALIHKRNIGHVHNAHDGSKRNVKAAAYNDHRQRYRQAHERSRQIDEAEQSRPSGEALDEKRVCHIYGNHEHKCREGRGPGDALQNTFHLFSAPPSLGIAYAAMFSVVMSLPLRVPTICPSYITITLEKGTDFVSSTSSSSSLDTNMTAEPE